MFFKRSQNVLHVATFSYSRTGEGTADIKWGTVSLIYFLHRTMRCNMCPKIVVQCKVASSELFLKRISTVLRNWMKLLVSCENLYSTRVLEWFRQHTMMHISSWLGGYYTALINCCVIGVPVVVIAMAFIALILGVVEMAVTTISIWFLENTSGRILVEVAILTTAPIRCWKFGILPFCIDRDSVWNEGWRRRIGGVCRERMKFYFCACFVRPYVFWFGLFWLGLRGRSYGVLGNSLLSTAICSPSAYCHWLKWIMF